MIVLQSIKQTKNINKLWKNALLAPISNLHWVEKDLQERIAYLISIEVIVNFPEMYQ